MYLHILRRNLKIFFSNYYQLTRKVKCVKIGLCRTGGSKDKEWLIGSTEDDGKNSYFLEETEKADFDYTGMPSCQLFFTG